MNYKQFIEIAQALPGHPVPNAWGGIVRAIRPTPVLLFPKVRFLPLVAIFVALCVMQVSLSVSSLQHQETYAYLQNVGSTEYVALVNTNY